MNENLYIDSKPDYIAKDHSESELIKYRVQRLEKENEKIYDKISKRDEEIKEISKAFVYSEIQKTIESTNEKIDKLDKKLQENNKKTYAIFFTVGGGITWVITNWDKVFNFFRSIFN